MCVCVCVRVCVCMCVCMCVYVCERKAFFVLHGGGSGAIVRLSEFRLGRLVWNHLYLNGSQLKLIYGILPTHLLLWKYVAIAPYTYTIYGNVPSIPSTETVHST